jgi:hypothetical protein
LKISPPSPVDSRFEGTATAFSGTAGASVGQIPNKKKPGGNPPGFSNF